MVQPSTQQFASAKTETEVAVLQVQFQNLNEKVDDLKTDLQDIRDSMEKHSEKSYNLIKELKDDNSNAHKSVSDKIAALEKWRWMIMGASVLAGALGWPVISKILGM